MLLRGLLRNVGRVYWCSRSISVKCWLGVSFLVLSDGAGLAWSFGVEGEDGAGRAGWGLLVVSEQFHQQVEARSLFVLVTV